MSLLNLETLAWHTGPDVPLDEVLSPVLVPFGDTVVLASEASEALFVFEDGNWVSMSQSVQRPPGPGFAAAMLPETEPTCN